MKPPSTGIEEDNISHILAKVSSISVADFVPHSGIKRILKVSGGGGGVDHSNGATFYRSARIIRCGGAKIDGTPLTAQTPGPNWLNFFVEAPQEDTFRGIGGIFEFRLRS